MFHAIPTDLSQRYLSTILEELHDEVYVYDSDTLQLIYANRTARLRCDWPKSDVRSKKIWDASANFDTEGFHKHVEPLRVGLTDTVTVETMHEKGLVEISTRMLSTFGEKNVFVSVLRNREHRRQLERARAEAFSEIVHDLRTPLTSIMGALKLMDSGAMGDLPPQAKDLVGLVQRNADNLLSIVEDILDLQKLGSRKAVADEDHILLDLIDLTKEAVTAHLGYCSVHNVSIELVAAPDHGWISGVPLRLHQLFANLLSNAIKNSPAGGTVHVRILDHKDGWQIRITNDGPGIPEHLRKTIFQNYVQATPANASKVKGTGLGLAICKKIVKSHGGEIGISCDTSDRTTFYVNLPKQDPPSEPG
ncbi:MAG: ATP-binding protein [Thalassovita sp.]